VLAAPEGYDVMDDGVRDRPPAPYWPPGAGLTEMRYGQVAPPLLLAAVLSPLPHSMNVPVALLEYL